MTFITRFLQVRMKELMQKISEEKVNNWNRQRLDEAIEYYILFG